MIYSHKSCATLRVLQGNHHTNVLQNVEPYHDAVLNLASETVPEDDACIETRWTVTRFKFKS